MNKYFYIKIYPFILSFNEINKFSQQKIKVYYITKIENSITNFDITNINIS